LRDVRYRHFLVASRSVSYSSSSRTKRSAIFSTGVKVCPQETAKAVISSHRAYYKLRVCQEAIWEAFRVFFDRVPSSEEYMSWVYTCQHENLCMDDLARNFSSSPEHLDMVARVSSIITKPIISLRGCVFSSFVCVMCLCQEEANLIPEKQQQWIVEFSVTVEDPIYSEILRDPTTPEYADVIRELRDKMYHVFAKIPGFKEIQVLGFRAEDVTVRYAVLFNGDTELGDQPEGYHGTDVETQRDMNPPKLQNIIVMALKQDHSLPLDLNTLNFDAGTFTPTEGNNLSFESTITEGDSVSSETTPTEGDSVSSESTIIEGVRVSPESTSTELDNGHFSESNLIERDSVSSESTITEGDSVSSESTPTEGDNLSSESTITEGDSVSSDSTPTDGDSVSSESTPTEGDSVSSESTTIEGDSVSPESTPTELDNGLFSESNLIERDSVSSESTPTEGDSVSSEITPTEGDSVSSESTMIEGDSVSPESTPTELDNGLFSESNLIERDSVSSESTPTEGDNVSSESTITEGDGVSSESTPTELDNGLFSESNLIEGDSVSSENIPTEGDSVSSESMPTEGDSVSSESTLTVGESGSGLSSDADRGLYEWTSAPAMRQASTPLMAAVERSKDLVVFFRLRVSNMMFTDNLFNKESAEYKSLENTFLELLLPYLETNLTGFKALEILSFQNGSVIVNSKMKLNKAVPYNVTEAVHCVLEDFCNSASSQLDIQVDSRSLEVEPADAPDLCQSITCSEFSRCMINGWSGEAECVCDPGYSAVEGQPCQSLCTLEPDFCLNGGLCQNIPGHGATCRCPVGKYWHYHGERCDELITLPLDTSLILTGLVGSLCLVGAVIGILIFINKKCIRPLKTVTTVHTVAPYAFDHTLRVNPVFQNDDELITQMSTLPYPSSSVSSQSQTPEQEHFASIENIHLSIEVLRAEVSNLN
ncbi:hypothetical protein NQD34_016334, partial [Periophthalmus magnuspinnatus]